MPMTLRLPEEIDRQARKLAEAEHRNLHSFIVNAVDEYIQRHGADHAVRLVAKDGADRYAEALDKLGKV